MNSGKWSARAVLLGVLVVGCDRSGPATVDAVRAASHDAATQLAEARRAGNAPAAKPARRRLEQCEKSIRKLQPTTQPADAQAWAAMTTEMAQARRLLKLVDEDELLRERTGSLKVKAYRAARGVTVSAALKSLSFAAQQSASTQPATTQSSLATALAQTATSIVTFCDNGLDGLSATQPAAPTSAARLSAMAGDPPDRIALLMAIGWTFSGRSTLALVETDLAQKHGILSPDERLLCQVLRSLALSIDGLPNLAAEEMQRACDMAPEANVLKGEETLGTLHLLLAFDHCQNRELAAADMEFALALRAWPNNPAAVFVTGERLNAAGEYERAAKSLEQAATGTKQQWLAEMIAQRARAIRDARGEAKPLLSDPMFIARILSNELAERGKEQASRCFKALSEAASALTTPAPTSAPTATFLPER